MKTLKKGMVELEKRWMLCADDAEQLVSSGDARQKTRCK